MNPDDATVANGLLVSADWLEANLANPAIRIVDTRKCEGYAEAHIPGAAKITTRPFLREEGDVISPASFSAAMADLGITPETTVIAYDDGNNLFAARLWFVLNHYGHHKVRVLDGGWDVWKAEGRPTQSEPVIPPRSGFTTAAQAGWIVDTPFVAQSLGHSDRIIVDTRSSDEWGRIEQTGETAPGRIPGAAHFFWSYAIDPHTHRFRSPDELRALFAASGITPDREAITYCQAGIRAAHTFFALKLAGFERVRNYEGSWLAWTKAGQPIALANAA
jgi:thiosulfate/3-mercaptopyruvate sulfurtransferase